MPKISLPAQNQIWQPNYLGDYWGDLAFSFQVNPFAERGKLVPSFPLVPHTTNEDLSELTDGISAFCNLEGEHMAACYNKVLTKRTGTGGKYGWDNRTNTPYNWADPDLIYFEGRAVIARDNGFISYSGMPSADDFSWYSADGSGGASSKIGFTRAVGCLAVMGRYLYYGTYDYVNRYNADMSLAQRNEISLPRGSVITWMKASSSKLFLGVHRGTNNFYVIVYDPLQSVWAEYRMTEGECVGFVWQDNLFILTNFGEIKQWTGTGFQTIAKFPIKRLDFPNTPAFTLLHRNGIIVVNDIPLFFVPFGAQINEQYLNNIEQITDYPAGIYALDPVSLTIYHYASLVPNRDNLKSYGLLDLRDWTFVSTGFYRIWAGALWYDGYYLYAGATLWATNNGYQYGIYVTPNYFNYQRLARGVIATPKIKSPGIDNIWQGVLIKYKIPTSNGVIIVKYQYEEDLANYPPNTYFDGTWQSSNQIQSSAVSSYNWQVGDELIIVRGDGSGLHTRITAIDKQNNKITIEDSFSGASGSIKFFVTNFRLMGKITNTNKREQFLHFPTPPLISDWIRLKLELRGDKTTIENIDIYFNVNERNI